MTDASTRMKGKIIHALSGFYYVEAADFVFECKAKGAFRSRNITPLVGDEVEIETDGDKGVITAVKERRNFLRRPPVANGDRLLILSSVERPRPNLQVLDKLTAFAVAHRVEPVILFSKCDLGDASPYLEIYRKTPFTALSVSTVTGEGVAQAAALIEGCTCAFAGNSGVGKSSLINALAPGLSLETNDISDKLGRGRHTTRSVQLYRCGGGFVMDTPGFSSFDLLSDSEKIRKEDLPDCFPEFAAFSDDCRFASSCAHLNDKGCAVRAAVERGEIAQERYASYRQMYEEVKGLKDYQLTGNSRIGNRQ